jgi:hypothetical protein
MNRITTGPTTSNPAGSPRVKSGGPSRPSSDVQKQDPKHTEQDFVRDLEKAKRRKPS